MWIFNKIVDRIIEQEVNKRRSEIIARIHDEEVILRKEYEIKLAEFSELNKKLESEIEEVKKARIKAEEEQKRLWERLDILKDNLNTEDVWVKLWECAFSKAIDFIWPVLQKETQHLVELVEKQAYIKAESEFKNEVETRMANLIKMANDKEGIPFLKIIAIKKKIEEIKLNAERVKNMALTEKCFAELELLSNIMGEKNDT